jgi:hypothetical protein
MVQVLHHAVPILHDRSTLYQTTLLEGLKYFP